MKPIIMWLVLRDVHVTWYFMICILVNLSSREFSALASASSLKTVTIILPHLQALRAHSMDLFQKRQEDT